jgi:hypothetical protein
MRAALRLAVSVPIMRAAILRACAFFFFVSALWALLPLVVRQGLGLGPAAFGLLLGASGGGAVMAGVALPVLRERLSPGKLVLVASLLAYAAVLRWPCLAFPSTGCLQRSPWCCLAGRG